MSEQETKMQQWEPTPGDIILMSIEGAAFLAQVVLTFLYYNYLGIKWLVYVGWALFVLGMIPGWRARVAFEKEGKGGEGRDWLRTTVVVDTDVYAVVRHPMYLTFMLVPLALILIATQWLNVACGAILMALIYNDMRREERNNTVKFGDDYRRYMEKVPRMNFVAGLIRLRRRRRDEERADQPG